MFKVEHSGYGQSEVIAGAVVRDEQDEMRDVVRLMVMKIIYKISKQMIPLPQLLRATNAVYSHRAI